MYQPAGAPEKLAELIWIPISGTTKEPRVRFKGAQVSSWRGRANDSYGILTGPSPMTDYWVWGLDLDIGDDGFAIGGAGWLQLDEYIQEHGHSWDELETFTVKTGSGGMHLLFRMEEGKWVKGGAGNTKIGSDVDVRGGRLVSGKVAGTGYLKATPSPGYVVVKDIEPIVAPDWLYELVKWEPPTARRQRKSSPRVVGLLGARSELAKAIASAGGDPVSRAKRWVENAIEAMTAELNGLWDQEHGWRTVGLSVTASLAGLVENDILAEAGVTSEDWAWSVMESWAELMDDGDGFYERHLEPMFLSKLGCADPARLPEDLEDALLDRMEEKEEESIAEDFEEDEEGFDYADLDLTDEIDPPVEWLIPNFLVKSMLNVITGPPKTVKSTIAGFLASRISGRVVWVARDGEYRGSIQRRLHAAGLRGRARILEEGHAKTPEQLMKRLKDLAEWAGPDGLFIFDSLAGLNKILGENEYSNSLTRTLWQEIAESVSGVTMLLVAHASQKDSENFLMGGQAIHQLLVHLLRARKDEAGTITVSIEMSRYQASGSILITGQLPGQDPAEVPPVIEVEFKTDGMLLIAQEKEGSEDLRRSLATLIQDANGIDSEEETTAEEWPRHSGMTGLQLSMAESVGLLVKKEGSRKSKYSLHTTDLCRFLMNGAVADEDDW